MKRLLFLIGCSGALLCAADLSEVHNVYVMPMARGFDQYLASRITSGGIFQVVTDPKLADAVLSDRIGESLQQQLETLFPTESEDETEPVAPPKSDKPAAPAAAAPAPPPAKDNSSVAAALAETEHKSGNPAQLSSFGRSKGSIFLVQAKSRLILWSVYQPPKSAAGKDLDRTASNIVSRLKKDLKRAQK